MTQPNPPSPESDATQDVAIGKLQKPRGLKGEIFCHPLTDFVERFGELETGTAVLLDGRREVLNLEDSRMYGNRLAMKFEGYDTPEDVGTFRNAELVVPIDETFQLPEDTFYVYDIVGMVVETEEGESVGTVKEVMNLPANDVYVVDRKGEEVLIPAVKELVTINGAAKKIVVRPLEGLI